MPPDDLVQVHDADQIAGVDVDHEFALLARSAHAAGVLVELLPRRWWVHPGPVQTSASSDGGEEVFLPAGR